MAYPPLNTAIQTTIACGHFFSVFFSPRAAPGSRSAKTEKTKKKQAKAENNELKTNTELHLVVFAYLGVMDGGDILSRDGYCARPRIPHVEKKPLNRSQKTTRWEGARGHSMQDEWAQYAG
jgi:hypothetical protein